jgi:crossover junction endodeoxyribonuclease RuvC
MAINYVGIDVGISGAVAVLDENGELVTVADMPVVKTRTQAGKVKTAVDAVAMAELLRPYTDARACCELVHAFRGEGVSSSFSFGRSLGIVQGVCAGIRMPLHGVQPQAWLRTFDLIGTGKAGSIDAARRLVPAAVPHLKRKRDHGRADALLISVWLREFVRREALTGTANMPLT